VRLKKRLEAEEKRGEGHKICHQKKIRGRIRVPIKKKAVQQIDRRKEILALERKKTISKSFEGGN